MVDEHSEKFVAMAARLEALRPRLNERDWRLAMGAEAQSWGHGGIAAVMRATGAARETVRRGMDELDDPEIVEGGRVRKPGGGRKKVEEAQPGMVEALDALVEPESRGDPMTPLRWTTKATRKLSAELGELGYMVSHVVVSHVLKAQGYSLQGTRRRPRVVSRAWWENMGRQKYPDARRLMITADCGGSDGNRPWLWNQELAKFAAETGMEITICHFPPGTSKCGNPHPPTRLGHHRQRPRRLKRTTSRPPNPENPAGTGPTTRPAPRTHPPASPNRTTQQDDLTHLKDNSPPIMENTKAE